MKVVKTGDSDIKIQLPDTVGVVLRYPRLDTITKLVDEDDLESTFTMIAECIDYIYDDEEIYSSKDTEPGELKSWVESLSQEHFKNIQNFFEDMPKIKYTTELKCDKCNKKHKVEIEGLQNFFV